MGLSDFAEDPSFRRHLNDSCNPGRLNIQCQAALEIARLCGETNPGRRNPHCQAPSRFKRRWIGGGARVLPGISPDALDSNNAIAGSRVRLFRRELEGRARLRSEMFRRIPLTPADTKFRGLGRFSPGRGSCSLAVSGRLWPSTAPFAASGAISRHLQLCRTIIREPRAVFVHRRALQTILCSPASPPPVCL